MQDYDVIIVGTGPAGVHAAWPLAMQGKKILILDGGMSAPDILTKKTVGNFEDIRRTDLDQWKLFLGEDFSGIPREELQGGQTSGNRSYVLKNASKVLPLATSACILQSLAQGGLGAVWGATGSFLSPTELVAMGLPVEEIEQQYDIIAERIGISGPPVRPSLQSPLRLDQHGRSMLERYEENRSLFQRMGVRVEQPPCAVLTHDQGNRRKTTYADMDYWADPEKSVYRPQYTLDALRALPNVEYIGGVIVESFTEDKKSVSVRARSMHGTSIQTWKGMKLILAAGAVNSARILLTSYERKHVILPFALKPHVFIPCFRLRALGTIGDRERVSLCQLVATEERAYDGVSASCAQLYSYRSMLLVRLLSAVPLPVPIGLHVLRILAPCLVIADLRFPGLRTSGTMHDDGSSLSINIDETTEEGEHQRSIKTMRRALRAMGLWTSRTVTLPPGSTAHYGGSIPFGEQNEHPFTVDEDCRLRGSDHIFIADASVFRVLPAKPHTFTIMANANRVGTLVARTL